MNEESHLLVLKVRELLFQEVKFDNNEKISARSSWIFRYKGMVPSLDWLRGEIASGLIIPTFGDIYMCDDTLRIVCYTGNDWESVDISPSEEESIEEE